MLISCAAMTLPYRNLSPAGAADKLVDSNVNFITLARIMVCWR